VADPGAVLVAAPQQVEIRRVPEPAEYATLSPEHEDYLSPDRAHR
jgi:hypothetical protein